MEQDGHLKTLAERMKEKAEQERIETEKVFIEQLQTLTSNLQESSKNVLHTISDALAQEAMIVQKDVTDHYGILRFAFGKKWICQAALSIAILFGMLAGGWGLVKAGKWHLDSYRTELTQLETACREHRNTLDTLEAETWGVTLQESSNGRFVVLPPGTTIDPAQLWNVGNRKAIRLE